MHEPLETTLPGGWEGKTSVPMASSPPHKTMLKPSSLWAERWLRRRPQPTLFQRCLALHIINASRTGALH